MTEVFATSPFVGIGGKRTHDVFSPHHSPYDYGGENADLDGPAAFKRRRLFQGAEEEHTVPVESKRREETPTTYGLKRQRVSSGFEGPERGSAPSFNMFVEGQTPIDPKDLPTYSARQLETELNKLRAEAEAHLAAKKAESDAAVGALAHELEKAQTENKILKKAVMVQNNKLTEVESQLASFQQGAAHAAEYVKRLEAINYALGVRVQQMGQSVSNDFFHGHPPPPDVF